MYMYMYVYLYIHTRIFLSLLHQSQSAGWHYWTHFQTRMKTRTAGIANLCSLFSDQVGVPAGNDGRINVPVLPWSHAWTNAIVPWIWKAAVGEQANKDLAKQAGCRLQPPRFIRLNATYAKIHKSTFGQWAYEESRRNRILFLVLQITFLAKLFLTVQSKWHWFLVNFGVFECTLVVVIVGHRRYFSWHKSWVLHGFASIFVEYNIFKQRPTFVHSKSGPAECVKIWETGRSS